MEKKDYKKEFCILMDRFAYRYSKWQVWIDFLSLSAISLGILRYAQKQTKKEGARRWRMKQISSFS